MKPFLLFFSFLLTTSFGFAQTHHLSPTAEISVLTIGPGNNLNDAFGHSAFRIKDTNSRLDLVYGYGQYDFDTPNFYLKFAQGKLNYKISKDSFTDFYYIYSTILNRTIEEQTLNLSQEEKQNFYEYLENNYKPENRRYLYDFFYDNCATRIRDVAKESTDSDLQFSNPNGFEPKTFRQLIHEHTGRNNWGSFGIDVALGSVIDRKATPEQHMFLPKYIHTFFQKATLGNSKKLVKSSATLFKGTSNYKAQTGILNPLLVFGLLAVFITYITYKDYKNNQRSKWLDIALFTLTGCVGLALLSLWFLTDHTATANNYNLLWAFPLNLLVLGQVWKAQPKRWFRKYLKLLVIMLCLMTLHWLIGIQIFAIGLIPLLIALAIRYVFLISHFNKTTTDI